MQANAAEVPLPITCPTVLPGQTKGPHSQADSLVRRCLKSRKLSCCRSPNPVDAKPSDTNFGDDNPATAMYSIPL